jgi:hypothetical protein
MTGPAVVHFPASLAQQRFWFLQCVQLDSPVFNLTAALQLDGEAGRPLDLSTGLRGTDASAAHPTSRALLTLTGAGLGGL